MQLIETTFHLKNVEEICNYGSVEAKKLILTI